MTTTIYQNVNCERYSVVLKPISSVNIIAEPGYNVNRSLTSGIRIAEHSFAAGFKLDVQVDNSKELLKACIKKSFFV